MHTPRKKMTIVCCIDNGISDNFGVLFVYTSFVGYRLSWWKTNDEKKDTNFN